jgi:hypothetical protein
MQGVVLRWWSKWTTAAGVSGERENMEEQTMNIRVKDAVLALREQGAELPCFHALIEVSSMLEAVVQTGTRNVDVFFADNGKLFIRLDDVQ